MYCVLSPIEPLLARVVIKVRDVKRVQGMGQLIPEVAIFFGKGKMTTFIVYCDIYSIYTYIHIYKGNTLTPTR